MFVEKTVDALLPMEMYQEEAIGDFPGPVPIFYSLSGEDGLEDRLEELRDVEGVEGVLVPFFGGREIECVEGYLP